MAFKNYKTRRNNRKKHKTSRRFRMFLSKTIRNIKRKFRLK